MKKSLFTIFLAILMLVTLVLPASAATGKVRGEATLLEDGTSFTVDLIVENNPGIIAITTDLSYDSTKLKLKSYKNGEIFESEFMPGESFADNPYKIIWMDATARKDITTNGVLVSYTFEVLKTATDGPTEIKFDVSEVVNVKMDDTAKIDGCTFKLNIKGVSGSNQSGSTSEDKFTNDQTIDLQKPLTDNTASDEADTSSDVTSSDTDTTIGADVDTDSASSADADGDRTMVTIITIAAVLLVGAIITVIAVYLRKKKADNTPKE